MGSYELMNFFLVEKQDGSPAVVSAPFGAGYEGNHVLFDSGSGDELGLVRIKITEHEGSPLSEILTAFTTIHPAKQVYSLRWSKEEEDAGD